MLPIPRSQAHVVFGVIQSGLTSLIASGLGSAAVLGADGFLRHWMAAWFTSWALMLPVVLFAAPFIRKAAIALTRDDAPPSNA